MDQQGDHCTPHSHPILTLFPTRLIKVLPCPTGSHTSNQLLVHSKLIALMMKAASTSKTPVSFYQTTWCNIPEDSHLHTRCHENLKSHTMKNCFPGMQQEYLQLRNKPYKHSNAEIYLQLLHRANTKKIYTFKMMQKTNVVYLQLCTYTSRQKNSKFCTPLTKTWYVLHESHGRCRDNNPARHKLCAVSP
jgi:hypothetical protein